MILKSRAKKKQRRIRLKAIPTALIQSLRDSDWRPLANERSLFRNYKTECKTFPCRVFLKAIPTALIQSLKDWAWRPLAYERSLIWNV